MIYPIIRITCVDYLNIIYIKDISKLIDNKKLYYFTFIFILLIHNIQLNK